MNVSAVLALAAPAQPGQQQQSPIPMLGWMVLLFVMFYFVLIRPQQKKAKEQAQMIKTVKSGDKIVTTSGIIATVINVKEDSLSVRSADAKLEITKGAIAEIRERSGEASAS
ncbi:MAG TPA: preprotein translocase subunit YajC [Candidatus Angelobacter sp.]|nr:preprotein translocase subunit YajC [Candidatus Angelobacter sp.]